MLPQLDSTAPTNGRVEILLGGEQKNIDKCTPMNYNSSMTMAEVAVCISNASDQAIAGAGKGKLPKDRSPAAGSMLG